MQNKRLNILLIAALFAFTLISSAEAELDYNTLHTSLLVRDKLAKDNLENMGDFIKLMQGLDMAVSYDPIKGNYAVFNMEDLKALFGEDAIIIASGGLVQINYKSGGAYHFFGALHGILTADTHHKTIQISKGGFSSLDSRSANIAGSEITLDVANPDRTDVKMQSSGAVYVQNNYFLTCQPAIPAQGDTMIYLELLEDYSGCEISATITPQKVYAKVKNSGIISNISALSFHMGMLYARSEDEIQQVYRNYGAREELYEGAMPEDPLKEGYWAPYAYGYGMESLTYFERISLLSGQKFKMNAQPTGSGKIGSRYRASSPGNDEIMEFAAMDDKITLFAVSAKNAAVRYAYFPEMAGFKVKEGTGARITLYIGDNLDPSIEQMSITSGGAFEFIRFSDDISEQAIADSYAKCVSNEAPFNDMACIFFDLADKTIKIKPRRLKEGNNYRPFIATIDPAVTMGIIKKVEISRFDESDTQSRIIVQDPYMDVGLKFDYNSVDTIPPNSNWYDTGLEFSAELKNSTGGYDLLECTNPLTTMDCRLNHQDVLRYPDQMIIVEKCDSDSDCSTGKTCSEEDRLCVIESQCETIMGGNEESDIPVVFISDKYPEPGTFDAFGYDIMNVLDIEMTGTGILGIKPFTENQGRFKFMKLFGGNLQLVQDRLLGAVPLYENMHALMKQCPKARYAIILSNNNFRSFGDFSGIAAVSMASQDRSSMEISVEDEEMNRRLVTAHEFAHSFGKLKDEYYEPDARYSGNTGAPNCLPKDEALEAWKQWPQILADAQQERWKGCGGPCNSRCANLLRPNENSIMKAYDSETFWQWILHDRPAGWNTFNEPSVKQLIDRINKG